MAPSRSRRRGALTQKPLHPQAREYGDDEYELAPKAGGARGPGGGMRPGGGFRGELGPGADRRGVSHKAGAGMKAMQVRWLLLLWGACA